MSPTPEAKLKSQLIHCLLFLRGEDILVFDTDPQTAIQAHPLVRHPWDHEECEEIASKIVIQKRISRDYQNQQRHPMAEAILACKNIEELSRE
jgi:hypothetical protein